MLIVSGIIFSTYGIFSLLTTWNGDGSFEWPTVVILIIGITLLPVGRMIKKQQLKSICNHLGIYIDKKKDDVVKLHFNDRYGWHLYMTQNRSKTLLARLKNLSSNEKPTITPKYVQYVCTSFCKVVDIQLN